MKHTLRLIRMLRFFVKQECTCRGAIIPYQDGTRDCPHEIAKQELSRLLQPTAKWQDDDV